MGRLENYSKKSVKNIINEHGRFASKYKNYVDKNRTKLNWNYGAGNKSADEVLAIIEDRCNTIMNGKKMQEQTNIMSDWIFTYPQDLCEKKKYNTGKVNSKTGKPVFRTYYAPKDPDHCRKWMDEVYSFCQDRYGAENVIAGYVHMDETTPHIDVNLVPEATSRKTGKNTVSSASLFTRKELSQCQRDLEAHMQKTFGMKGMVLNGRTKGGYTIDELKQRNHDRVVVNRKALAVKAREDAMQVREDAFTQKVDDFDKDMKNRKEKADKRDEELDKKDADITQSVTNYNNAVKNYNVAVSKLHKEREEFEQEKREYKAQIRAEYESKFHEHMQKITRQFRNSGMRIPDWALQAENEYKKDNDGISL